MGGPSLQPGEVVAPPDSAFQQVSPVEVGLPVGSPSSCSAAPPLSLKPSPSVSPCVAGTDSLPVFVAKAPTPPTPLAPTPVLGRAARNTLTAAPLPAPSSSSSSRAQKPAASIPSASSACRVLPAATAAFLAVLWFATPGDPATSHPEAEDEGLVLRVHPIASVFPSEGERKGAVFSTNQTQMPRLVANRWSAMRAWGWRQRTGPLIGVTYVPSTAGNQLEMWQDETWDPELMQEELALAKAMGMTAVRVPLHDLLFFPSAAYARRMRRRYGHGSYPGEVLMQKMDLFLDIARHNGLKVVFVFFDGTWRTDARSGKQPKPLPRLHKPLWLQSPSHEVLRDRRKWGALKTYLKTVLGRFARDDRVAAWDLYNRPDAVVEYDYMGRWAGVAHGAANDVVLPKPWKLRRTLELLALAFIWAREVNPSQPVTSALRPGAHPTTHVMKKEIATRFTALQFANSDIITFHYSRAALPLKKHLRHFDIPERRPVLCTDYLARSPNASVSAILPLLTERDMGAFSWGLVAGRAQALYPIDSWWQKQEDRKEPSEWYQDLLQVDSEPHVAEDWDTIESAAWVAKLKEKGAYDPEQFIL